MLPEEHEWPVSEGLVSSRASSRTRIGTLRKRLTLWRPRVDMGSEVALRRWQGDHVSLVERVPGLKRYRQTLCVDGPDGTPPTFLGLGEVWFEDVGAAAEALASPRVGSGHRRVAALHEHLAHPHSCAALSSV